MPLVRRYWIHCLLALSGFSLGLYPEISAAILSIATIIAYFQNRKFFASKLVNLKNFSFVFTIFLFLRILLAWRTSNFLYGVLEITAIVLMLFASFWLHQMRYRLNFFSIFLVLGLILVVVLNTAPRLIFAFQGGTLQWISDRTLVKETKVGEIFGFQAITPNSYILQNTTMQGSGRVRYQVEVRAEKPFKTSIGFIQSSLSNGRVDRSCLVTIKWTRCFVDVNLAFRSWAQLGIGGFGTWNPSSPILEIRNSRIIVLQSPNVFEVLTDSSRIAGFSFSFNAFGANAVVVGLIAIILAPNFFWINSAIFSSFFCILLSGSRGALTAFIIGLLVVLLARGNIL